MSLSKPVPNNRPWVRDAVTCTAIFAPVVLIACCCFGLIPTERQSALWCFAFITPLATLRSGSMVGQPIYALFKASPKEQHIELRQELASSSDPIPIHRKSPKRTAS